MNARARAIRAEVRQRTRTQRAASRIARRGGEGSLVTHLLAVGLSVKDARSAAGSMRTVAKRLGITGVEARTHAAGRMRTTHRYTPDEIAAICMAWKARKPAFRSARVRLLAAVPATRRTTYHTAA